MKIQLKDLQKQYGDDRALEEFREISDRDFGRITTNHDIVKDVDKVLGGKAGENQ